MGQLLAPLSALRIDVMSGPEGDPMVVGEHFEDREDNRHYKIVGEDNRRSKIVGPHDETVMAGGSHDKKRSPRWSPIWRSCLAITGPGEQGTGFFITPTSVITAAHVVPNAESLRDCTLFWGLFEGHHPVELKVSDAPVRTSKHLDFTIFGVMAPREAHILPLDAAAEPVLGESVTVYGNPSGGGQLRRSGADSQIVDVDTKSGLIHYRADTLPGGSGGPVLSNRTAKLLAVHLGQDGEDSNRGRMITAIRREFDA